MNSIKEVDDTKLLKIGLPLLWYRGNRTGPHGPSSGEVRSSDYSDYDGAKRSGKIWSVARIKLE